MKSINELYQEVKNDEELRNKFLAAYRKGEIEVFLKENNCDATDEEALRFVEQEVHPDMGELSDEELALVVGGKGENNPPSGDPKYREGQYVKYNWGACTISGKILEVLPQTNRQHRYKIHPSAYKDGLWEEVPENCIEGLLH